MYQRVSGCQRFEREYFLKYHFVEEDKFIDISRGCFMKTDCEQSLLLGYISVVHVGLYVLGYIEHGSGNRPKTAVTSGGSMQETSSMGIL
jgi:hypothetical protein